jgi:hypothetical protein
VRRNVGRDVRVGRGVVVLGAVDGVDDAVGCFVETVTERMIVTVFVVISHITLVLLLLYDNFALSFTCLSGIARVNRFKLESFETRRVGPRGVTLLDVLGWLIEVWFGGEVVKLPLLEAG